MAENTHPEQPDPGPPSADIPDLKKKAQRSAPTGFSWSADAVNTRGAAGVSGGASARSLLAKLKSTALGNAARFVVLLGVGVGVGLGVFGVAMFEVGEKKSDAPDGLKGIFSSLRVRPGGRDRMRYIKDKGGLIFSLFNGGQSKKDAPADEALDAAGDAAPAQAEGGAPAEQGDGAQGATPGAPASSSRAGVFSGGASSSQGAGGVRGDTNAASELGAGAKFNAAAGKLGAKDAGKGRRPRGVSAVSDDRRAGSVGRAGTGRTMSGGVVSMRGAGAQSSAGATPSGLNYVLGDSEMSGAGGPTPAATAAGAGDESGGGGGSSPGGGAGGPGTEDYQDPNAVLSKISALLDKASSETKKAEQEKKKAALLTVAGQFPQAAYHFNKGEKAEKKAKEYSAQAQRLTESITPKDPPPSGQ
ncbi:MAG: hypothetical protein HY928_15385 [Elusimicrobia bacterium]|nr:hypothetical protein [Elusimicrobiota bacterium]